ncbi:GNAT family N-acetyltransferase [Lactiplantibacillus nangangensis]|uniref:GNAT family N-acetyltransferase n=1 Tax=Lactiplantibacillus nangangensis TaxID=2559917 RepID=A0ABW1SNL1_9LACO|nr:GNAT family protein [Lactiplantibacillus nangangensis]
MTQFETDRLIVRPMRPTDHDALQAMLLDPRVVAYLRYRVLQTPAQFTESFKTHFLADAHTVFGLERKSDHQLIGFYEFHSEATTGELTYALSPDAWGHGYVAEAGRPLMAYGFETLNYSRIEAHYASVNPRSGRVMAKLGMHDLGEMDTFILDDGELIHVMRYALSKKDWLIAKSA